MEEIKIDGSFSEPDKFEIIKTLSRMKGKRYPATFNNIPVKTRVRQSIVQEFKLQTEIEDGQKLMDQKMRDTYR